MNTVSQKVARKTYHVFKTIICVNILCRRLHSTSALQKCGVPNFDMSSNINNWSHCDEEWAQLNLKSSFCLIKKNPTTSELPYAPQPTCKGKRESTKIDLSCAYVLTYWQHQQIAEPSGKWTQKNVKRLGWSTRDWLHTRPWNNLKMPNNCDGQGFESSLLASIQALRNRPTLMKKRCKFTSTLDLQIFQLHRRSV